MNIIVLDTETINLERPFVYDLGYIIYNLDTNLVIKEKSYIISQVFDDEILFSTAYYKEKRPIYLERLKNGYSKKVGWGNAMRFLKKDIEKYNITNVYAFNSPFDYKAFKNTCAFFNASNPLELLNAKDNDIMSFLGVIINTPEYIKFCQDNNFMTKNQKPKKTAETLHAFITNNASYEEEHTGLEDSKIELNILLECRIRLGLN